MLMSRRFALGAAMVAAVGASRRVGAASMLFRPGGRPLGINLYMLGADYTKDIDGTLQAVAAIGYREVETNFDVFSPAQTKAALLRAGLRCTNISVLADPIRASLSLRSDAGILADGAHTVGAEYITCNLFPLPDGVKMRPLAGESVEQMLARVTGSVTADDWRRSADYFNAKGAEFKRHGIKFAYHNHNAEFAAHGDTNGLAILLEHTDPALVHFEMDMGWVVSAGHDPVEILKAYPGRFAMTHIKDVARSYHPNTALKADMTEVGSGVIDWKRVIDAALVAGVRHFNVEQDPPYALPRIEAARKSFNYLRSLEI